MAYLANVVFSKTAVEFRPNSTSFSDSSPPLATAEVDLLTGQTHVVLSVPASEIQGVNHDVVVLSQNNTSTNESSPDTFRQTLYFIAGQPPSPTNLTTTVTVPPIPAATDRVEPKNSSALSPGAIAGVAIGTAVAGAVIACLVIYIMSTRRKKIYRKPLPPVKAVRPSHEAKSYSDPTLDYILPQAVDDHGVESIVDSFFRRIEDHVDSRFYLDDTTKVEVQGKEGSHLAAHNARNAIGMIPYIEDGTTRSQALKAFVCAELLASIDFRGRSEHSLLPPVVTEFLSSLGPDVKNDHPARLSLSRWRTSTSFLLKKQVNDHQRAQHAKATETLLQTLQVLMPYAHSRYETDRQNDLLRLFKKAEGLGDLLLSQPAEWAFDWAVRTTATTRKDQSFVVFPALIKVTDESARLLQPTRVVIRAKLAQTSK